MVTTAIKIQKLESLADLDCLVRGDVIDSIYQNMPLWKYGEREERIVFHRQFQNGALQFVLPAEHGQREYIIIYKARKDQIERRDGKIKLK